MKSFLESIRKYGSIYGKPKFYLPYVIDLAPKKILDIGLANESYVECKSIYPDAIYHGIDYFDVGIKMCKIDKFFLCNLEDPMALDKLDNDYDLIIVNHVLEHVGRGEVVFSELCNLLASNGVLYAEFPSIRTAYRRKQFGNYHFHDDHTHKKFYNINELANRAIENNCKIISCGPVSTFLKNILSIPRALFKIFQGKAWGANLLHLSGKIDHIAVRKVNY